MQFYKKKECANLNNEYIKMIEEIKEEQFNNVCFECGSLNPEYISINNGIFLCQECIQGHLQFPQEISQIIINDLFSLNNNQVKKLYLGGNKNLIEFINFDYPRLKQFSPDILYKTNAIEYYRKRLEFYVKGGQKPLKPFFESAYHLINSQNGNNSFNSNINNRKDILLSPKINNYEKLFSTQLTPILEGNQLEDENNLSNYSEKKNEDEKTKKTKENILSINDSNIKNESTFIYSPQKPRTLNGNNSAFINANSSILNRSLQADSSKNNNIINIKLSNNSINAINNNKHNDNNKPIYIKEDMKFNSDKNISEINSGDNLNININPIESNNNLNNENFGDDNTIRIIDRYINLSKENDSTEYIRTNKGINDSQLNNKEKNEDEYSNNKIETESNNKIENDQSNRIIKK